MKLSGKRIILTGAAGGIGYRLALLLAQKGAQLALVERNAPRLEEICKEINQAGGKAYAIALDLTSEGAAGAVVEAARQGLRHRTRFNLGRRGWRGGRSGDTGNGRAGHRHQQRGHHGFHLV